MRKVPWTNSAKERENSDHNIFDHKPRGRQGETTSAISQDKISIGYPEPALQQNTDERQKDSIQKCGQGAHLPS